MNEEMKIPNLKKKNALFHFLLGGIIEKWDYEITWMSLISFGMNTQHDLCTFVIFFSVPSEPAPSWKPWGQECVLLVWVRRFSSLPFIQDIHSAVSTSLTKPHWGKQDLCPAPSEARRQSLSLDKEIECSLTWAHHVDFLASTVQDHWSPKEQRPWVPTTLSFLAWHSWFCFK